MLLSTLIYKWHRFENKGYNFNSNKGINPLDFDNIIFGGSLLVLFLELLETSGGSWIGKGQEYIRLEERVNFKQKQLTQIERITVSRDGRNEEYKWRETNEE